MGFKCGIVGLPNVGKSTIFNAINKESNAQAANYPFCTIEPNKGIVPVPDSRLDRLEAIYNPKSKLATTVEFYDIAGLVAGAAKGEGLGNKFLNHIREVESILHVVRCFNDENVTHVDGSVDPIRDIGVIDTELCLKDLETISSRYSKTEKLANSGDKECKVLMPIYEKLKNSLESGIPARRAGLDDDEKALVKDLYLLTMKTVLYCANVGEEDLPDGNEYSNKVKELAASEEAGFVIISGKVEAELMELPEEEQKEYLESLGLEEPGLNALIRSGYATLNLLTYFTAGPKEVRAWTVRKGAKAPEAAGVIHTDFERGFIRAETMSFEDIDTLGNPTEVKEKGLLRVEGKNYTVQDGDVMLFLFNV